MAAWKDTPPFGPVGRRVERLYLPVRSWGARGLRPRLEGVGLLLATAGDDEAFLGTPDGCIALLVWPYQSGRDCYVYWSVDVDRAVATIELLDPKQEADIDATYPDMWRTVRLVTDEANQPDDNEDQFGDGYIHPYYPEDDQ